MRLYRREEGFTLIELMVVVLIIGILVAIAVPVFFQARANAEKKTCWANQRTIDGAIQTFIASSDLNVAPTYPDDLLGEYLAAEPLCPTNDVAYTVTNNTVNGCPDNAVTGHGSYTD